MNYFMLMLALSASDIDVENAEPLWVLNTQTECQLVADTLNKNSDTEYLFCVVSE